uniref:hypothetical protein n=1 Tax=Stenotrophomonas maltophilia TaxID=40324 RepID=UPI0019540DCD
HYAERLLLEFRGQIPAVRSVSIETLTEEPKRVLSTAPAPAAADSAPVAAATASPGERPQFDSRFTFDRFVIDATNRVACNAAKA